MSHSNAHSITLLVADNDWAFRTLARATFERDGSRIVEADDGQTLIEAAKREHPDFILITAELPPTDGFETCATIRSLPGFEDTAIVVVTELEDRDAVHRAYKAGATDVISKPVNWDLLTYRTRLILQANEISRKLVKSEFKNRALVEANPDTVLVIDRNGALLEYHGEPDTCFFVEFTERSEDTVFDALPARIATRWREQAATVLDDGQCLSSKFRLKKSGITRYYETRMVPYIDDHVLVTIRDNTEQGEAAAKVRQLTDIDTLTGLGNRQCFLYGLAEAIRAAEANDSALAVLCIDLDKFKRINESLGHAVGDELLQVIADRLRACVRQDDFVAPFDRSVSHLQLARLGGDEFMVILRGIPGAKDAESVAERITTVLSEPLTHRNHEIVITASIGIAMYPGDGADNDTLLKNADVAMSKAKAAGGNGCCVFSGAMEVRSLERLDLEDALRRAIADDSLELHYQPKLGLESGQVTGVEALVRWHHPVRGLIPPTEFIPLAEEAGLIVDLSNWILHRACRQIREWREGPVGDVPIAVNLSGKQFRNSDVYSVVKDALFASSIDPWLLELELTESVVMESVLMDDAIKVIDTLNQLKEAGISLAVDDFGTGYCSLSYLKNFPIDALKIDSCFVAERRVGGDDASFCATIITLGHSLGLKVIAEGVENKEQLSLLREQGCDEIQGYYFARPRPADVTARFLLDHRGEAARPGVLVQPREKKKYA